MAKKTDTWAIRYFRPSKIRNRHHEISSTTFDVGKGTKRTLLSNGKLVEREMLPNEQGMLIGLFTEHIVKEIERGNLVENRYAQQLYEVPKSQYKESDFGDEWDMLKRNKAIVDFLKEHAEVSYKDIQGKQLNTNFPVTSELWYNLSNLDAIEDDKALKEEKEHELTGILISIKKDPDDLLNLAYGLGINPVNMSNSDIFNLIKDIIREPVREGEKYNKFEKFVKDGDNWYTVVLNKALRTPRTPGGECFILNDGYNNFSMNGVQIATNFIHLVSYFKDHDDLFEGLMTQLNLKKKQLTSSDSITEQTPAPKKKFEKKGQSE